MAWGCRSHFRDGTCPCLLSWRRLSAGTSVLIGFIDSLAPGYLGLPPAMVGLRVIGCLHGMASKISKAETASPPESSGLAPCQPCCTPSVKGRHGPDTLQGRALHTHECTRKWSLGMWGAQYNSLLQTKTTSNRFQKITFQ